MAYYLSYDIPIMNSKVDIKSVANDELLYINNVLETAKRYCIIPSKGKILNGLSDFAHTGTIKSEDHKNEIFNEINNLVIPELTGDNDYEIQIEGYCLQKLIDYVNYAPIGMTLSNSNFEKSYDPEKEVSVSKSEYNEIKEFFDSYSTELNKFKSFDYMLNILMKFAYRKNDVHDRKFASRYTKYEFEQLEFAGTGSTDNTLAFREFASKSRNHLTEKLNNFYTNTTVIVGDFHTTSENRYGTISKNISINLHFTDTIGKKYNIGHHPDIDMNLIYVTLDGWISNAIYHICEMKDDDHKRNLEEGLLEIISMNIVYKLTRAEKE